MNKKLIGMLIISLIITLITSDVSHAVTRKPLVPYFKNTNTKVGNEWLKVLSEKTDQANILYLIGIIDRSNSNELQLFKNKKTNNKIVNNNKKINNNQPIIDNDWEIIDNMDTNQSAIEDDWEIINK